MVGPDCPENGSPGFVGRRHLKKYRMSRTPEPASPVRKSTRAARIVGQVRDFIYTNHLKPGDRLPAEHDLAKQLNVSRSTLREALKGLTANGLLESRPRSGTRVRKFSYDQVVEPLVAHFYLSDLTIREILEARAALELAGVTYVVQRATPEQIEGFRKIEAEFERITEPMHTRHELDLKLHEALLAASGNRLLASMVGLLRAFFGHPALKEDSAITRHLDENEIAMTTNEHRLVIEAIAARDVELANRVLREHFGRMIRWLDAEEAQAERLAAASTPESV
jgi:GntR family transcriptional regulator, transcriptional repressor for pyruvate dehydrogenase complex